jgi:hypothetical protein
MEELPVIIAAVNFADIRIVLLETMEREINHSIRHVDLNDTDKAVLTFRLRVIQRVPSCRNAFSR